ncbi:hypothetical protein QJ854_gp922 [Moumouvirus goulette]|uniref:Uncharacterized protein n=1 Tax=Moumouvirus goulette TaxID=1247379 RepID=M1NLH7_9VIRU|nr:hypothetical protein QJ854_gp922 [Moumouvirus goulette]AGF84860.1 hypothetical protein glt_00051 [Moumouvirus goulette]
MSNNISWIFMVIMVFFIIVVLYYTAPLNNPQVWIYVGIIIVLIIIILYLITIPITIRMTCENLLDKIKYDNRYYKLQNNS